MVSRMWPAQFGNLGVRKAMHKRGYGQWFAITFAFALKIDVFLSVVSIAAKR